jgi:nicotinate-nucleotide adenylyltransferase
MSIQRPNTGLSHPGLSHPGLSKTQLKESSLICSFGGTFDPFHFGHLEAAMTVSRALGGARVNLILSARPSHRGATGASIEQRLAMLEATCAQFPLLQLDTRECRRDAPSYTVDTLLELQQEHPGVPLVWVIGSDAYHYLPTWYRWREVVELAHLLVLDRVGYAEPPVPQRTALAELEAEHQVESIEAALASGKSGSICRLPVQLPDISATRVRQEVQQGYPVAHLLPAGVSTYIRQQRLYCTPPSTPAH